MRNRCPAIFLHRFVHGWGHWGNLFLACRLPSKKHLQVPEKRAADAVLTSGEKKSRKKTKTAVVPEGSVPEGSDYGKPLVFSTLPEEKLASAIHEAFMEELHAAQLLGLGKIFLDCFSGAKAPVKVPQVESH
jgi:hypothetical protein